jgi:hypothetical protein
MRSDTSPSAESSRKMKSQNSRALNQVENHSALAARSRFIASPSAGLILGERDEALLADLLLNRVMTRAQIQELHFGSVQRCNDRLRRLFDWEYVSRYYLPSAPFGSQALFSLGKAGVARAVRAIEAQFDCIAISDADVRIQCMRPTLSLLEHTLAIADVYIALKRALAIQDSLKLDMWLPERLCREEYDVRRTSGLKQARWRKEAFSPDAFFRMSSEDQSILADFFLEVDLGHTNSKQFESKLQIHRRFKESGLFAKTYGSAHFNTLVVTTGERRLANLVALAKKQECTFFWFSTMQQLRENMLDKIWHSYDQSHAASLDSLLMAKPEGSTQ